jgi:asparagine synthase (glutamine-hydrolysing)
VRDGRLKHLMKASLADLLPDDILNRKKRGFGTPMGAWLKRELAPLLRELLSAEVVRARACFAHAAWCAAGGRPRRQPHRRHRRLLALMNLEIWSRIYLDGADPATWPTN